MPITFNCPCGKALRIADENAGKRIKCPACQAIGTAPAPVAAPKFELVEDEPPAKPTAAKPKSVAKAAVEDDDAGFTVEEDEKPKKKPIPARSSRDDDDDEDERPKKKKRPRRDDDDDDEDERPRRRRPSNPDAGKKIMYLAGGLILTLVGIAVAVYWWQTGPHEYTGTGRRRPFNGYIFGGACAVVGILTAIKGITGRFGDDE